VCVCVFVCVFECAREEAGGREGQRAREKKERKECYYGVATISRLLKMIGLFCRIQFSFIGLFCKRDL